jgi:hypothetical protein
MTVIQEPSEPREALDTQIHHAVDAVAGLVEVAAGTSGLRDRIIRLLVTFATYVAAGTLGILWLDAMAGRDQGNTSASLTVLWLAPGFGVACLLRYGRRAWPAIAAGSIVLWGFIRHAYLPLIVVESAGEALSIVLIVTLLRSWGFRPTLDRYKDSLLLIAALAIGRTVSSAIDMLSVIGAAWVTTSPRVAAGLAAAGAVRHGDALAISPDLVGFAARWWANTVSGSLLVVPLRALRFHTAARRRGYHGELALRGHSDLDRDRPVTALRRRMASSGCSSRLRSSPGLPCGLVSASPWQRLSCLRTPHPRASVPASALLPKSATRSGSRPPGASRRCWSGLRCSSPR